MTLDEFNAKLDQLLAPFKPGEGDDLALTEFQEALIEIQADAQSVSQSAFDSGFADGDEQARKELIDEVREQVAGEIREGLALLDTDRVTARTPLERATGRYIFNLGTKQTCLL